MSSSLLRLIPSSALGVCALGAVAACVQPAVWETDSGPPPLVVGGRVVDVESCWEWAGCDPVEGVEVSLGSLPGALSEPTGAPGRFEIEGFTGRTEDLVVSEPGGSSLRYVPTLNPGAAPSSQSDVHGLEIYAVPTGLGPTGAPTVLSALRDLEGGLGLDLLASGGYMGQAVVTDAEGQHAVEGAEVELILPDDWPSDVRAPTIRFIQNVPRFASGQLLYEMGHTVTGPFGVFVVPTLGRRAVIRVRVRHGELGFREVDVAVRPGVVSFAVHSFE